MSSCKLHCEDMPMTCVFLAMLMIMVTIFGMTMYTLCHPSCAMAQFNQLKIEIQKSVNHIVIITKNYLIRFYSLPDKWDAI